MTRSINPVTASTAYRVEARMPGEGRTAVTGDFDSLEEALTYVTKTRETAAAMIGTSRQVRETGSLKLWRVRASLGGGRVQLNLIPESEWNRGTVKDSD